MNTGHAGVLNLLTRLEFNEEAKMNIKQEKAFSPVTITLETEDEVRHLYANLTKQLEAINLDERDFAHQLSELIRKETNVFDWRAP